jgi:hypothetical protein
MGMMSNRTQKRWTRLLLAFVTTVLVLLSDAARSLSGAADTAVAIVAAVGGVYERQGISDTKPDVSDGPQTGEPARPSMSLGEGVLALVMLLVVFGFVFVLKTTIPEPSELRKETLKNTIVKAIENSADLRAVKQIYFNREQSRDRGFVLRTTTTHYPMSIPLSVVLEDIRADLFINSNPNRALVEQIDALIAQHLQINPFDQLEPTQKDQFERLREKIGEGYDAVQLEVTRIADELHARNSLTQQYLRKSTVSFWVSITGLSFSLIIGGIQIYQWLRGS